MEKNLEEEIPLTSEQVTYVLGEVCPYLATAGIFETGKDYKIILNLTDTSEHLGVYAETEDGRECTNELLCTADREKLSNCKRRKDGLFCLCSENPKSIIPKKLRAGRVVNLDEFKKGIEEYRMCVKKLMDRAKRVIADTKK